MQVGLGAFLLHLNGYNSWMIALFISFCKLGIGSSTIWSSLKFTENMEEENLFWVKDYFQILRTALILVLLFLLNGR